MQLNIYYGCSEAKYFEFRAKRTCRCTETLCYNTSSASGNIYHVKL